MAATPTSSRLPPGLAGGVFFFGVVLFGCSYIVLSKANGFRPLFVTAIPVVIMIGYAVTMAAARFLRLRDDQAGDNLYYMGFLFTLTSLAVSLYQFSSTGSSEQIVQNFGIAIASTIAGITLRILFHQMRHDPIEVEATARLELADASRRVKRELEGTILEFGYFRRMTQQSIADALEEMKTMLGEARETVAQELRDLAGDISRPLEETSKRSGDTVEALADRMSETLDGASGRLVDETDNLSKSAAAIVKAFDAIVAKLEAMQTPEQVIEIKLAPMVQGLSRAVNSFSKSAEVHEKTVDKTLKQTQDIANAVTRLIEEMRASEAERDNETAVRPGPWGGETPRTALK